MKKENVHVFVVCVMVGYLQTFFFAPHIIRSVKKSFCSFCTGDVSLKRNYI